MVLGSGSYAQAVLSYDAFSSSKPLKSPSWNPNYTPMMYEALV